jgi:hypothetical protein
MCVVILNVIMLNVIIMSVAMLNDMLFVVLSIIMTNFMSDIKGNVIIRRDIMLSVIAPQI